MGFSQTELAEKVNLLTGAKLRHNVISNYENGITLPSLSIVPTIAAILNTTVDFLVGKNEVKNDSLSFVSVDQRREQLKNEYLDLKPFMHIKRVNTDKLNKSDVVKILHEQYDLIDQLLKEISMLKDDNIETKEKLLTLREKLERFLG